MEDKKVMLTIPEVCEILRISRTKAYELAKNGNIPTFKIGRSIRIPAESLNTLINSTSYLNY